MRHGYKGSRPTSVASPDHVIYHVIYLNLKFKVVSTLTSNPLRYSFCFSLGKNAIANGSTSMGESVEVKRVFLWRALSDISGQVIA